MRYAKMTATEVIGLHVSNYTSGKDKGGEIFVRSGRLAELTGTTVFTDRADDAGKPVFNGRLFDLATNEQTKERPVISGSRAAAREWWTSVAPEAPIPEELLEVS